MATPARPLKARPPGEVVLIDPAVADELRIILNHRDEHPAESRVEEFLARYSLTDHEIDALLAYLAREGGVGDLEVPEDTPTNCAPSSGQAIATTSARLQAAGANVEPGGVIEESQNGAPDEDLAWMFEDEPESPILRSADDVVGQAVDDLLGDWSRTGGQLTRAEVALLATTRKLSPAQHGEVLELLEAAGVDLPVPTEARPSRAAKDAKVRDDSVGQYLRAIGQYPLINASREVELWSLISQGRAAQEELDALGENGVAPGLRQRLRTQALAGRQAHGELVCANLRLVVSVAKGRQYELSGVEFADRIQDGNLGLMHAADKFDGSKGFKFSTYATHWIRQSIDRGIADRSRLVRLPVHAHEQVQKVRKAVVKLTARLDRDPSLSDIADMTGLEPGRIQWALDVMRPFRSLDELLGDEGDLRLSDILLSEEERDGRTDPAEIVIHAMFHADVERALSTLLPKRAADIIERRFGLGTADRETLEAIGADYGVTRERIRQIENKALKQLRESDQASVLRSYLLAGDSETDRSGGSMGKKAA